MGIEWPGLFMQNKLLKNILATVTYYDILDYPMTSFEIWKYLTPHDIKRGAFGSGDETALGDIIKELESAELREKLDEFRGFYFLKGRKNLVRQRIEKNKISEKKFKTIKRAVWWLRFVPYVKMIAITGRMAMKNADKKSDLDLLIVLENGRIFTGRVLVTLLVHVLGIRRYENKIKNRICLNYFMADENLKSGLDELFFSSDNSQALHLFASSEYSFIYPVFGRDLFQKFQKANEWVKSYKINYRQDEVFGLKTIKDSNVSAIIRKMGEFILGFGFVEKKLKKWQMARIMSDSRTHQSGSFVTANDKELIFFPKPQGLEIEEKYLEKLKHSG